MSLTTKYPTFCVNGCSKCYTSYILGMAKNRVFPDFRDFLFAITRGRAAFFYVMGLGSPLQYM